MTEFVRVRDKRSPESGTFSIAKQAVRDHHEVLKDAATTAQGKPLPAEPAAEKPAKKES